MRGACGQESLLFPQEVIGGQGPTGLMIGEYSGKGLVQPLGNWGRWIAA